MGLLGWFHRKQNHSKKKIAPSTPPDIREHDFKPIRINAIADYLKLIGKTILIVIPKEVGSTTSESYRGRVKDLSDAGDHLILEDVYQDNDDGSITHHRRLVLPLTKIDFIVIIERGHLPPK
ncbi:hypothetical protein ACFLU1_03965 [Chloroflexota bacterium]